MKLLSSPNNKGAAKWGLRWAGAKAYHDAKA